MLLMASFEVFVLFKVGPFLSNYDNNEDVDASVFFRNVFLTDCELPNFYSPERCNFVGYLYNYLLANDDSRYIELDLNHFVDLNHFID